MESKLKTLGYVLMGLLSNHDASGYDLQLECQQNSTLWSAQHSHIYPELRTLEKAGFVTHRRVAQEDHPNKKVYHLTNEGREALAAWVAETPAIRVPHDEMLIKASLLWLVQPEKMIEVFTAARQQHFDLAFDYDFELRALEQRAGEQIHDLTSPFFARHAVLKQALAFEDAYTNWCDHMIRQLMSVSES